MALENIKKPFYFFFQSFLPLLTRFYLLWVSKKYLYEDTGLETRTQDLLQIGFDQPLYCMTLMPPYKRCVYSAITAIKHLTLSFLSKSSLGYNIFWSTNPFLDHTHLVFHVPLFCKKKKKITDKFVFLIFIR